MARRKKKGKSRKSKTMPLLPTLAGVYPAYRAYNAVGLTRALPGAIMLQYTGYDANTGAFQSTYPIRAGGMVLVGYVGHRVANKVGINRQIKKLTGGWLVL